MKTWEPATRSGKIGTGAALVVIGLVLAALAVETDGIVAAMMGLTLMFIGVSLCAEGWRMRDRP